MTQAIRDRGQRMTDVMFAAAAGEDEAVKKFFEEGDGRTLSVDDIDYEGWLHQNASAPKVAERRMENVWFLLDSIKWILERFEEEDEEATLEAAVAKLLLRDMLERQEEEEETDQVQMLTLHASKGLEYPHVFLVGMEEDLLPHRVSIEEDNVEEERRLAYVGLTRARKRAFISFAANRRIHGQWTSAIPSRFIDELPQDFVEIESDRGVYAGIGGGESGAPLYRPGEGFSVCAVAKCGPRKRPRDAMRSGAPQQAVSNVQESEITGIARWPGADRPAAGATPHARTQADRADSERDGRHQDRDQARPGGRPAQEGPGRHGALHRCVRGWARGRGEDGRRRRRRHRAGADADRACSPARRRRRAQPLRLREEQQPQGEVLEHQGSGSAGARPRPRAARSAAPTPAPAPALTCCPRRTTPVQPFTFNVGTGSVIKGWDEGVLGMELGEVATLDCTPDYAYGSGGFPAWGIMPNSRLVFEIEVLSFA